MELIGGGRIWPATAETARLLKVIAESFAFGERLEVLNWKKVRGPR